MNKLNEDSRQQLLTRSKSGANYAPQNQIYGKNRYDRRLRSKVSPSVKEYNSINMNKLFKDNILDVSISIHGETNDYHVKMSFGGFLDQLNRQVKSVGEFNLRAVQRALVSAFNSDNVYIHCECPDWKYRFGYWARVSDISSDPDNEASNNGLEIVNPNNDKGAGCKHTLLVLSNTTWLVKVASVITNYVNYMQEHYPKLYADIIYPAIYNKKYEEPVQLDLDTIVNDEDELETNTDIIDTSNKWARTKGQFKKGNQSGVQFAKKDNNKQIAFDNLISDN